MGLQTLRSFPWVDYVCTGEGDAVFPEFMERLLRHGDGRPIPGILKQGESASVTLPPPVRDLDDVATPDYSDYFEQRARSPIGNQVPRTILLAEASRGCWWGAKHQCRFCGLGGVDLRFRSKSPARVLAELEELTTTYPARLVQLTDNVIDVRHIETVFAAIAESGPDVEIHCEIKSTFTYRQLATLRRAGVTLVQPGIESFSTEILDLMRKGCTALQNIRLLRWCEELDLAASWLILYGFPGEPVSEYARMAKLIPLLAHLRPPGSCRRISLQRFSPYFAAPGPSGMTNVRPRYAYQYVLPASPEEIEGLSTYFEYDLADGRNPRDYTRSLHEETARWEALWYASPGGPPQLDLFQAGDAVIIADTRPCARQASHRLEGIAAAVYLLCDTARTPRILARELNGRAPEPAIREVLAALVDAGLMWEDAGEYLSLAIFRNRPGGERR